MRQRGFEVANDYLNQEMIMPERSTQFSAGYDMFAAEDVIIDPYKPGDKPTLVPTGVKAYMMDDEVLYLYNRSSNPKNRGLVLANGVGIIDKDYYNNESNDGLIYFAFYNIFDEVLLIRRGETIGQAIFQKYLTVDNDISKGVRVGGFGSTGK